jgi:hypothetical protein
MMVPAGIYLVQHLRLAHTRLNLQLSTVLKCTITSTWWIVRHAHQPRRKVYEPLQTLKTEANRIETCSPNSLAVNVDHCCEVHHFGYGTTSV